MDIHLLRLFIDVARNGSINRAAQLNFLSSSSVSRSIKTLEQETNTQLFKRSYHGITLTNQGKELYAMVEPILLDIQKVEQVFCSQNEKRDVLRLTLCVHQNSVSYQAMLDFYNKYAADVEYVDIVVAGYLSCYEVIKSMQNKYYMLGTIQYNTKNCDEVYQLLEDSNMILIHENSRRMYVCVSETHPLTHKSRISLADLEPYTRLAYIDERVADINYCADLYEFDTSKIKRRILIRERAQLDEVLRATDAYFIGTGNKGVKLLDGSRVDCIPFDTDQKILTGLICRKDYILTESAKHYRDILIDLFDGTD